MKKKDLIVIVGLCLVLSLGYFVVQLFQGAKDKDFIEVTYKNKVIEKIDISVDKTYTFEGSYGKFSLEVKDRKYHAVNVECPNHDCEKVGWVKEGSLKTIICIPNEIYVVQAGVEAQY